MGGEQDAKYSLRHLCFLRPKRTNATGEDWVSREHPWGNVPDVPKSHSIQFDSWSGNKLGRGGKRIVEGSLLGFVVQAHSGWVSLPLMFVCYSYARVNHSALRHSSSPF